MRYLNKKLKAWTLHNGSHRIQFAFTSGTVGEPPSAYEMICLNGNPDQETTPMFSLSSVISDETKRNMIPALREQEGSVDPTAYIPGTIRYDVN